MITRLEELSLNAWPALQTVLYDGWIIRFAAGYTKRANSVNPLYFSTMDVEQKINYCESLYESRKLPVVFKMTSAVYPDDLDLKLTARGYRKDSPTSVQILDLGSANLSASHTAMVEEELSEEWLGNYCRMNAIPAAHNATLKQILLNIIPRHCFVLLKLNNQMIACGLGVLQSEQIGLFDIVTDFAFRNQGYGAELVKNILRWGQQNHAQTAYLQVMLNNAQALQLYEKIGFVENYQYWYRIKE